MHATYTQINTVVKTYIYVARGDVKQIQTTYMYVGW